MMLQEHDTWQGILVASMGGCVCPSCWWDGCCSPYQQEAVVKVLGKCTSVSACAAHLVCPSVCALEHAVSTAAQQQVRVDLGKRQASHSTLHNTYNGGTEAVHGHGLGTCSWTGREMCRKQWHAGKCKGLYTTATQVSSPRVPLPAPPCVPAARLSFPACPCPTPAAAQQQSQQQVPEPGG